MRKHPLYGFLCAACGRCLEELPAWIIGAERFYCAVICREADEARRAQPSRFPGRDSGR